jgi:ribosome-binding factor A
MDMPQSQKGNRPLRIAAEIKRDLPEIIRKTITLPADVLVTVTDVVVSSDLGQAKVYFSVIGMREQAIARTLEQDLNRKRGLLRTEIARRLVMRQHPELKFIYDETPARAARIESLLNQIHNESRNSEPGASK